ncbi:MAG: 3-dehydroquinate synthase [Saprospiraceae bacterium]|nr:3-dehydroquinate synthase [Saprospiraceae bacterium]
MAVINCSDYQIFLDEAASLAGYLDKLKASSVFVLVDEHSEQNCLVHILEELPENATIIQIDGGEKMKNLDTAGFVWRSLLHHGADRKSVLINLGGGVICDLGGFCAATFMRGMRFIQMPTTLLAQVDASVGGKLGIDLDHHKNMVGVFRHPESVIIHTRFLKTLPYKQLQSGYAEILKHCLIADAAAWADLEHAEDLTSLPFQKLIAESLEIKSRVVNEDPEEKGLRKILNFGHTIGHAIEGLLMDTDRPLTHGDAIAIGMVCESHLAMQRGFISAEECARIKNHIIRIFGHKYKSMPPVNDILKAMRFDKKNVGGIIRFSLLEKIGKGNYDIEAQDEEIIQAINWYIELGFRN